MRFSIYQISRQGPRQYNQDRVAYAYSKDALLAVLADGMGGHLHGEIAAEFAVKVMVESFQRLALPTLRDPTMFLQEHIRQVHDSIGRHAQQTGMAESPCTTMVAALVQRDMLYCAHAGDSRLYHFRDGQLLFRTEDHSKVQLLFRQGLISREQMLTHPQRNVIYNCVGGDCLPQVEQAPRRQLLPGDVVMLCSDGLWSLLGEAEMGKILRQGPVTDSVPALFDLAETRADINGDNMSAIAFQWGKVDIGACVSTASMPLNENTAVYEHTSLAGARSVNEDKNLDAIEYAIAEIQLALQKNGK
jgi:serine/threonine protein phosphatase PrpC